MVAWRANRPTGPRLPPNRAKREYKKRNAGVADVVPRRPKIKGQRGNLRNRRFNDRSWEPLALGGMAPYFAFNRERRSSALAL